MVQTADSPAANSCEKVERASTSTATAVRGDVVNDLNQSSQCHQTKDNSLLLSQAGDRVTLSFNQYDLGLDLGNGLKLNDPGARIVGGRDSISPQLRGGSFDERSDYFQGQLKDNQVGDARAAFYTANSYDYLYNNESFYNQFRNANNDQVMDRTSFDKMFKDDVRKAYSLTGNSPSFYNAFPQVMQQDLQRRVDAGEISAADLQGFKDYVASGDYKKDVRDVYQQYARSPKQFWDNLESRMYEGMQKYRQDVPTPPNPDDRPDNPPEPKPDNNSASVKEARDNLHKSLEGNLSGDRLERFDAMMKQFEKRGSDRVEALVAAGHDRATAEKDWNDKIKQTYDQLNEMVKGNSSVGMDKDTRTKLAENAMYLFMDPSKENQGQHGTCWLEGPANMGMINNPEDMARLLKEVTLTGKYTDKEGRSYNIPSNYLQFTGEEASWSISNADAGYRSPAGALFDRTLAAMCGRSDGGTNGGDPSVSHELIRRVTGQDFTIVQIRDNNLTDSDIQRICSSQYQKQMLEQGGILLVSSNHEFAATLKKNNGQWNIIGDNQWGAQNDQLIGRVSDLRNWNVQTTRERYTPEEQNILRGGMVASSNDATVGQQVQTRRWFFFKNTEVNAYMPNGAKEAFSDERTDSRLVWRPTEDHTPVRMPENHPMHHAFDRRRADEQAAQFRRRHEELMRRLTNTQ